MKYFPFFILLGALLISCEKYIDMEIPDNGRKIVINSIYNDNTDIVINLTMSRFILDNSDYKPLSGATVELYENDVFIGNLNESEAGMYISSGFRATTGSKQKIIISKGDQTITAISYLPNKVPITFIDTTRVQKDYMKLLRFRFSVSDPSTTDNFYMIGFAMEDSLTQGLMERYSIYFYTDDPFIEKTGTEAYGVFSDESFKGQTKTLAIDIDLYNFSADTTVMYVSLLSVSKDTYLYIKSANAQMSNSSPFSEPIMVYSNIDNGFGIFGGYSIYKDSIIIYGPLAEEYPIGL